MNLKEHVRKLAEGGLISPEEHQEFEARYNTSEGKEQETKQEMPAMGSHSESALPSSGYDEYLAATSNEYRDDAEPEEMQEPSRDFLDALRRKKRSF